MSGLIPMIFWAFRRFQAERAALPFIAWGFLGVVLMGLATSGAFHQERQEQIIQRHEQIIRSAAGDEQIIRGVATGIASLSGANYDAFQRTFRKICSDKQRVTRLNQKYGITEREMAIYCQCLADALAREMTAEDVRFFQILSEKKPITRPRPACI